MQTTFESPPEAKLFFERSRAALSKFLSLVNPTQKSIVIRITNDLYAEPERQGKLYLLTEGMLSLSVQGEIVFTIEEGDLLGLENLFFSSDAKFSGEFAVRADEYTKEEILRVAATPEGGALWSEYLALRLNGETLIIAALGKGEKNFTPDIRSYKAGEVIIVEGSKATEVYTLLKGHANVTVKGIVVGEILADELFGVLAALTNTPRTASVTASTNSLVLSLDKEKFLDLMYKRPALVLNMVENMSRTIVSLNQRVVNLSVEGTSLPPLSI